jgi:hypothetical protein
MRAAGAQVMREFLLGSGTGSVDSDDDSEDES